MTIRPLAAAGILAAVATTTQAQRFELAKLEASDGRSEDLFGAAVAIGGPLALVGAPLAEGGSRDSGTTYYFDLSDPHHPAELGKLVTRHIQNQDHLGCAVATAGDRAIAGASMDDEPFAFDCGSASLVHLPSGGFLAKFIAPDCAAGDQLGHAVAITEAIAIAGAPGDDNEHGADAGSVYLFERTFADPAGVIRGAGAFGFALAAEGNTLVVGAPHDEAREFDSGSASLFDISDPSGPILMARLTADDGARWDRFGESVVVEGSTVLIGAPGDENDSGSVYVFTIAGEQVRKLRPRAPNNGESFGASIDIDGGLALIGAPRSGDNMPTAGAAYLFDIATGRQIAVLLASDGGGFDELGVAVAISGDIAVVGAHMHRGFEDYRGAAYVFSACPPDRNGDGATDSRDFIGFLIDWAEGDLDADWDGGGAIDSRDFIAYLNDWAAGCEL